MILYNKYMQYVFLIQNLKRMAKSREEQIKELQERMKRFSRTSERKKMRRPDWEEMAQVDQIGESGRPEDRGNEAVAAFQRKEKQEVAFDDQKPVEIPNWLKAKITKRTTPEEVLEYLMERVRRAPSKNALLLAQYIINDLGRRPGGSKTFKRAVTKEQVKEIITLSNPK